MSRLSPEAQDALQAVLNNAVAQGVPGLVAGITDGQNILWTAGAGKKELGSQKEMTPNNVFWIASCTKMVTAMAAMQLVEQGKLSLDEPIAKIVPELATPQIIENGQMRAAENKDITLRQLLTHTGGFSYTFFNEDIRKHAEQQGQDEFDGELKPHLGPLIGEPGKVFRYGTNIDIAGLIIERVSGMSLGDYFEKNIFGPIGAKDISFDAVSRSDRLAGMHQRTPDGKVTNRKHFPIAYKTANFQAGGSGLFASVKPYLQVIQVLLNKGKAANGTQILKAETVEDMFRDHVPADIHDQLDLPIPTARPDLANHSDNLFPAFPHVKKGWGLSWLINHDHVDMTGRSAGSAHWAGLANLFWTADPKKGVGLFIQSQILPFGDQAVYGAFLELERIMNDNVK